MSDTHDTSPAPLERAGRRRFNYDPTINLGHVLSLASFLIAGSVAYFDLRERITVQEERTRMLQSESIQEKERIRSALHDLKEDVREVRKAIDNLQRR